MPEYELEMWDPSDPRKCPDDCIIQLVGERGAGKSTLLRDLMYHRRHMFDTAVAYVRNHDCKKALDYIPDSLITIVKNEKEMAQYQSVMDSQDENAGLLPKGSDDPDMPRIQVVLDDLGCEKKIMEGPTVKETYTNGRHYKLALINCVQYIYQLPKFGRANSDILIVLMKSLDNETAEALHKTWFKSFIPRYAEFVEFIKLATMDRNALVYSRIENKLLTYRAQVDRIPRKFLFGTRDATLVVWSVTKSTASAEEKLAKVRDKITSRIIPEESLDDEADAIDDDTCDPDATYGGGSGNKNSGAEGSGDSGNKNSDDMKMRKKKSKSEHTVHSAKMKGRKYISDAETTMKVVLKKNKNHGKAKVRTARYEKSDKNSLLLKICDALEG